MKKKLLILLILHIGVLNAQKNQSELIVGTWRFEKEIDIRNQKEKSDFVHVTWCPPETENGTGYPDRIFKSNNEFEFYLTKTNSDYGIYRFIKNKLFIERRLEKKQVERNPEAVKRYLKRKLLLKKDDGFYYFKPQELLIKSISKNQIEFGNEKEYTVWKRIK